MFDIGWAELLVIAVIAIVVVGPKDLPRLMATIGRYVGKARRMAAEFQRNFEDMARDAEIEDLKRELDRKVGGTIEAPRILPDDEAADRSIAAPEKPADETPPRTSAGGGTS